MTDFEVHLSLDGETRRIGCARSNRVQGKEIVVFEYADEWLQDANRFELEPDLALTRGAFAPSAGKAIHGSLGDSAPDTWGRRLMQRAERRQAVREGRAVRTLMESDYLLGVSDETRLGALRFRRADGDAFLAETSRGVPALVDLGRLLQSTDRILRDEETDEDLQLIFAPGSSLGGARPKASVIDRHGRLSIAKFPKESDEYSIETWEEIALRLADRAGIVTAPHELLQVAAGPCCCRGDLIARRGAAFPSFPQWPCSERRTVKSGATRRWWMLWPATARRRKRTLMPCIDAWRSMSSFPMSTTTCATMDFSGSIDLGGRSRRLTT